MNTQTIREFLAKNNIGAEIIEHHASGLTSKDAANAHGVGLDKIVKTLLFIGKNENVIVILACTDLQLVIKPKEMPIPVYDTMDLLVDATVRELMK